MTDPACPATTYALAPLVTRDDLFGNCGLDLNIRDNADMLDLAMVWASRRVMMATRYRFMGCQTATIRPCNEPCEPWTYLRRMDGYTTPNGHLFDEWGMWGFPTIPIQMTSGPSPTFINCWECNCTPQGFVPGGGDPRECACGMRGALRLPYLPVRDVLEVKIDGSVLNPASYTVKTNTNLLVRVDGTRWPDQQNEHLADTEVGTWSVKFRHGADLPPEARPLVAAYACQLALRALKKPCDLSDGVQIVQRSGVSYTLVDTSYRAAGLTGYQPVDDWIYLVFGGHSYTRPHLVANRPRRLSMWA